MIVKFSLAFYDFIEILSEIYFVFLKIYPRPKLKAFEC